MRSSRPLVRVLLGAVVAATFAAVCEGAHAGAQVVLTRGETIRIVYVGDAFTFPAFTTSFANAIAMAVAARPTIKGFPVEIETTESLCGDGDAAAAAATSVASDPRNVAVLGHVCSAGFEQALPVYEAAGIVAITGSASSDALPVFAPTVFDRLIVADGSGAEQWYTRVVALPSDLAWQEAYAAAFGIPPLPFADLYYDAATLLLRSLQWIAFLDGGDRLVIDRSTLAAAVRSTAQFQGVSCRVAIDPATGNRVNDPVALDRCTAASGD
jgi:ABC-type branched-subunit amino acid transport system substrate-binding protein